MELVHGGTSGDEIANVESIYQMIGNTHFTSISYGANAISGGIGKLIFEPSEPLESFDGLIGTRTVPASRWFGGNCFFGDEFFAPAAIAGGSDGDALFNGVKVGVLSELVARLLTSGLEEFDIGFTVSLHLSLHDKVVIDIDLLLVPTFEVGFLLGRHAIWIVHVFGWHGSFVMLVFSSVEFVWEESLAQFRDPEGGGEVG